MLQIADPVKADKKLKFLLMVDPSRGIFFLEPKNKMNGRLVEVISHARFWGGRSRPNFKLFFFFSLGSLTSAGFSANSFISLQRLISNLSLCGFDYNASIGSLQIESIEKSVLWPMYVSWKPIFALLRKKRMYSNI